MMFRRIDYQKLNARQQENHNFHKVAARLADFGYNSLRLNDDWQGADFLAVHVNGNDVLKIQLKGRFGFDAKYRGQGLWIAFMWEGNCYVYPHDTLLDAVEAHGRITETSSWSKKGNYHWPTLPAWATKLLAPYRI